MPLANNPHPHREWQRTSTSAVRALVAQAPE